MLLEKLSIENYGVYAGKNTLDLSSTKEKPLVLIGGFNGAGKTTIFESLMIALYGKSYLGRRTTKKDYLKFITSRIHKHNGKRAKHAHVGVAFRFHHNGSESTYLINRNWTIHGASVSESFSAYRDNSPIADVDETQWQSFIEGLIPLGIARLFFFDGEKIVRVTEWKDNHDNEEMNTALEVLLGTEMVTRLNTDLDLYLVRKSSAGKSNEINQKYEQLNKEKKFLTSEIAELKTEQTQKEHEIEETTSKITTMEQKVSVVGGGYAKIRDDLIAQNAVLEEKTRHQKKAIIETLSEDVPLYLATGLLERIKSQVESDLDSVRERYFAQVAKQKMNKLKKEIKSTKFWPDKMPSKKLASASVIERLDTLFVESNEKEIVFDLAPQDADWMIQKITHMQSDKKALLQDITEYDNTVGHLEKTKVELGKIPKDDEIGPRISEINSMYEELGLLKSEHAHLEQTISSKRAYLKILQNRLKVVLDTIHQGASVDNGARLASRMQSVLNVYLNTLRERKIRDLESNLLDTARLLLHKKSFISKIEIDRDTFEIRAYDSGDLQIPGGLLSMGERQIVGTALLWAIARTSGRSLPFVIDTPLGRLDGRHLANLTEKFYPFASHQTILLSTDREIGLREYKKLLPYISRSYRIIHDESKSTTSVVEGYFMEEEQLA